VGWWLLVLSLLLLLGSATILIAVTGWRPDTLIGHTLTGCLLIGGLMSWSAFVLGPISGFMIAAGYRSSELAADRFAADLVGARGAALPAWLSARGTWPTNPVYRARLRVAGSHPSPQRRQQLWINRTDDQPRGAGLDGRSAGVQSQGSSSVSTFTCAPPT